MVSSDARDIKTHSTFHVHSYQKQRTFPFKISYRKRTQPALPGKALKNILYKIINRILDD